MATLTNDFHRTRFDTPKTEAEVGMVRLRIAARQATEDDRKFLKEARAALCGMGNCRCFPRGLFHER